jgi:hypothetical protein
MRVKMPHLLCRVVYIAESSKTPDFGCCDDGLKPGYKKNRARLPKGGIIFGPSLIATGHGLLSGRESPRPENLRIRYSLGQRRHWYARLRMRLLPSYLSQGLTAGALSEDR